MNFIFIFIFTLLNKYHFNFLIYIYFISFQLLYAEAILKQQKKKRQEGPAIEYWTSDLLYEIQKEDRMLNEGYD